MQKFEGSRGWQSNIYGALTAGLTGVPVFAFYLYIILTPGRRVELALLLTGFIAYVVIGFLMLFPGNLITFYPVAAELEEGKGMWILAPLKRLYIPFENIKEVNWSWLYIGWRVKLSHRQGLLYGFVIKKRFGVHGPDLVEAIRREIGAT